MLRAQCKTVDIDIQLIKPYWRNPRKISERAVATVRDSIKEYGFNQPIVLDKNHVIVAGHTRYKALMQLGYKKVSCVVVEIDEKKAKEYRIADNKTNEIAEWDMQKLIPELFEIDNEKMSRFFDSKELDQLLMESSGNVESYHHIDQDSLKEKQVLLDTAFTDKNKREMAEYIGLSCPECHAAFNVKRNDILTRSD